MPYEFTVINIYLKRFIVLLFVTTDKIVIMNLTLEQAQAFGKGIMRWIDSGEITLKDLCEGGKTYNLLVHIHESPLKETVDSNFNGMSFDQLCGILCEKGRNYSRSKLDI